jgi:hypothetical protein
MREITICLTAPESFCSELSSFFGGGLICGAVAVVLVDNELDAHMVHGPERLKQQDLRTSTPQRWRRAQFLASTMLVCPLPFAWAWWAHSGKTPR